MNKAVATMFAPMGPQGAPQATSTGGQNPSISSLPGNDKAIQTTKIDSIREEKDLIDLSSLVKSSEPKKDKGKKGLSPKDQPATHADTEKKQQTMLSTLDIKKKELQKQKELLEKLNRELQQLDAPTSKEIASLRSSVEQINRDLSKATKVRKQKEMELLEAIELVSKLGDEKCAVSERLKSLLSECENAKQKKLKELEDQMHNAGV